MITTRAFPSLLDPGSYPIVFDTPTRFADLDYNMHINNVAMAAIIQEARVRLSDETGVAIVDEHSAQMLVANNLEYFGQAHYPDDIRIGVGISELGRSSWRCAVLASQNGTPCAFSDAVMVMTDGAAPIALPDDMRPKLERLRIPPLSAPVQDVPRISARDEPALLDPARYPHRFDIATRFADLDTLGHVNNVAAMAVLEDARLRLSLLGDATRLGSFAPMMVSHTIDYLGQMHYPGTLSVSIAVLDIGRTSWRSISLAMQDGRPCMLAVAVLVMTDGQRPIPISDEIRARMNGTLLRR